VERQRDVDEAANDSHCRVALLAASLEVRSTKVERGAEQARREVLLERAENGSVGSSHIVGRSNVERLPCPKPNSDGVFASFERDLLMIGEAFLLGDREHPPL
jgi:hypothetical protein